MYNERDQLELEYTVSIVSEDESLYYVYMPIPGMPHTIEERGGVDSITTEETVNGTVYNISVHGSLELLVTGYESSWPYVEG
jgi:hypothetical protein